MITAGSIKVHSRFSISSLLDMEMETKEGCHSRLALRGLLSEGKNGTELPQDAILVKGTGDHGPAPVVHCLDSVYNGFFVKGMSLKIRKDLVFRGNHFLQMTVL